MEARDIVTNGSFLNLKYRTKLSETHDKKWPKQETYEEAAISVAIRFVLFILDQRVIVTYGERL